MLSYKIQSKSKVTRQYLQYSCVRPRMDILSTRFHVGVPFGGSQGPVRVRILGGVWSRSEYVFLIFWNFRVSGLICRYTRAIAEPVHLRGSEQSI